MRKIFLLFMTASTLLSAQKQRNAIEFERYELPNGLKVILHQDASMPVVAVSILYNVGSKNELEGRSGFAHFFEHLMFEGSENIQRGEFMKLVQGAGGQNNAYTTHDKTYYYEVLPSNQLQMGLWMEAERMLHAKIDIEGVETQREVVKEEKRMRYDNQPYMSFQQKMFSNAYKIHPYKYVPIGSMEDLNAAQLEEFMDFYKLFYVPNNATLTLAGDFDAKQAKTWIEQYFGSIPKGTRDIPRPIANEPDLKEVIIDTVYDNIQIPAVFMGYRMPAKNSEDALAVNMLSQLLSSGRSSRLKRSLVDDKKIALEVSSFPYDLELGVLFISLAFANMGTDPNELLQAIDEEINKVRTEKISPRELERVLNQIENQRVARLGSMEGIAEQLADYEVFYGDANIINSISERTQAITAEKLLEVAQKYFDPNKRIILYYLPKKDS